MTKPLATILAAVFTFFLSSFRCFAWVQIEAPARPSAKPRMMASESEADQLRREAEQLRQDVASFENKKKAAEDEEIRLKELERSEKQAIRDRYSAMVPILKPDGSTQEERCDFLPKWDDNKSFICVCEALLPIGVILGESEDFPATTVVDEVAEGSNGDAAGLKVGDIVRACTACKLEMEQPAWQLIAGGIGIPKTKRFMYQVDGRPFEECMEAVASNRQDPEQRPVLLVVERRET